MAVLECDRTHGAAWPARRLPGGELRCACWRAAQRQRGPALGAQHAGVMTMYLSPPACGSCCGRHACRSAGSSAACWHPCVATLSPPASPITPVALIPLDAAQRCPLRCQPSLCTAHHNLSCAALSAAGFSLPLPCRCMIGGFNPPCHNLSRCSAPMSRPFIHHSHRLQQTK